MRARASSRAIGIAVVAAACCSLVALLAVATYMATRGGGGGDNLDDPALWRDLPTTPPRVYTPLGIDSIRTYWTWKSNCWHVNYWVRVTATNHVVAMDRAISAKSESQMARVGANTSAMLSAFPAAFRKCDGGEAAYLVVESGRKLYERDVTTFVEGMKKAFQRRG
jgi:hypothetical protein